MEIKTVADACSISEFVKLWNRGFEGYAVNVKLNSDRLLSMFAGEGLSPDLSLVAIDNRDLVGFVCTGIKTLADRKVAWNGGTGIVPTHRRRGIGNQLMAALLEQYQQAGVAVARLESILENRAAIQLYERNGYKVVDGLTVMDSKDGWRALPKQNFGDINLRIQGCSPAELAAIVWYNWDAPWQTQWGCVEGGQGYIAYDEDDKQVGYALSKRSYSGDGLLTGIVVYQCEIKPDLSETKGLQVTEKLLETVFAGRQEAMRMAMNISERNLLLLRQLESHGLRTNLRQVHMENVMEA